jgi:hypothetical protein
MMARALWFGLASCLSLAGLGCSEPPPRTLVEDQSRRVAPLPACVMYLPARRPEAAGAARRLREEQVVKLLFPDFTEDTRALPQHPACNGRPLLDDPLLAGGTLVRGSAWPFIEQEGDVQFASGGDRIKIVWLRMLRFADGTVGGPLAIVRAAERFAEAFAIGVYRGHPDSVRLGTQRFGGEVMVTATEDACTGRKAREACESKMILFLPRAGSLGRAAELSIERVAYAAADDRGAPGTLQYRMTASTAFKPEGIRVAEQIRVTDDDGREIRKADVNRLFALDDAKGTFGSAEPPLWDLVVGNRANVPAAPAAPAAPAPSATPAASTKPPKARR